MGKSHPFIADGFLYIFLLTFGTIQGAADEEGDVKISDSLG